MAILLTSLVVGCWLAYLMTGSVVPSNPTDALIFQSTLLFVVLGSAVLEHKFTRPADSAVNALMAIISLVTVYAAAPRLAWWMVFGYSLVVFTLALICSVVSTEPNLTGWRKAVARYTYQPAVFFGKARLLFSIVFLFGVFAFYGTQAPQTVVLVCFWGFFLALWPLGVPELLSGMQLTKHSLVPVGRISRVDAPNLVRVELSPDTQWSHTAPHIYEDPDGLQHRVIPLYKQATGEYTVGTGLCVTYTGQRHQLAPGRLYPLLGGPAPSDADIARILGGDPTSTLIGFVIEDSTIATIRFETWRPDLCRQGLLVWTPVAGTKVFYQVTGGVTREESLEENRHGFQFALAAQIGTMSDARFTKYPWLPPMNTPVFCEPGTFGADLELVRDGDFVYGTVPGTRVQIGGDFAGAMDHHTAILGVTGSGKTELAFDLIRYSINAGIKVLCIDLTARYEDRLEDVGSENLSISEELSTQLSEKLFEAETGPFGAGKEKKALKEFADPLRAEVAERLTAFMEGAERPLGIITLDEISNTRATLFITELYLSCLLHYARDNPDTCPRILVVVEEAHTAMPEPATMGLGDYESRGLVSKIAQVALQGRKYGVGLLVIAQRTATVSKTVLTQCNTIITLNCFDETSVGFLSNVYGKAHARLIANLPRLHAVVFGKAVRSERPIVVEIPFNAAKAEE